MYSTHSMMVYAWIEVQLVSESWKMPVMFKNNIPSKVPKNNVNAMSKG